MPELYLYRTIGRMEEMIDMYHRICYTRDLVSNAVSSHTVSAPYAQKCYDNAASMKDGWRRVFIQKDNDNYPL